MAKPRVVFNDGSVRTLQSDHPDPASRFRNVFGGETEPIGDTANALADESNYMFRTSTRYGCRFEIHGLFQGASTSSAYAIAQKLRAHLIGGGRCQVIPEDALSSNYATCGLMPGTKPEIFLINAKTLEYGIRLALINLGAATDMVIHYAL